MNASSKYVFFYNEDNEYGCFSNFYKTSYTISGICIDYTEKGYMMSKAIFFNDYDKICDILNSKTPRIAKDIGRTIMNFDIELWKQVRRKIMYIHCYQKFSTNKKLKKLMLSDAIRDKYLVEASPSDKVWGIGLNVKNAQKTDPSEWPGQNLLGKTLNKVKKDLINNNSLRFEKYRQQFLNDEIIDKITTS